LAGPQARENHNDLSQDARGSEIRRKVNGGLQATAFSPAISMELLLGQSVAMAR
jgi:hypothetical protein